MEKKFLWWNELAAKDVTEYAKECDIAILPLGSIEQHGPHCPTGDDSYNSIVMSEMIAKKTGVMLLPCPWYGSHPYHHWHFPGTIPLRNETQMAMIKDIVRGAAKAGYNKFIILSSHGQLPPVNVALHELGLEGFFVLSIHWYEFVRDVEHTVFEAPMWHAEEVETYLALYLFPQYVDMSRATKEKPEPLIDRKFIADPSGGPVGGNGEVPGHGKFYYFEGTFFRPEYKELTSGIIGDATKATREKGEKIVNIFVERVSGVIDEIKAKWPPGVKPPVI
jgi:creatinine amidohydrolase/Fe(II)-dependent formamide hydrolase-like protein